MCNVYGLMQVLTTAQYFKCKPKPKSVCVIYNSEGSAEPSQAKSSEAKGNQIMYNVFMDYGNANCVCVICNEHLDIYLFTSHMCINISCSIFVKDSCTRYSLLNTQLYY